MNRKRPPTQKDVAEAAGVHQTTVSLALRNHPSVPATTRRRILATARRLGYRKHPLVSALMRMRMRAGGGGEIHTALAFLTDFPTENGWRESPTAWEMYCSAQRRARELGYRLDPFWLRDSKIKPRRLAQILHARNVHGVLLAPTPQPVGSLDFDFGRFASVGLGASTEAPCILSVVHDHFSGMQETLARCRAAGRRRPALYLGEPVNDHVREKWMAAWMLPTATLPARDRIPPLAPLRWDGAKMDTWLRRHRPDALIGTFGESPLPFLADAGWRVPRELVVASLNLHEPSGPLAGIDQASAVIGARAVELLIGQIERNEEGLLPERQLLHIAGHWHSAASFR